MARPSACIPSAPQTSVPGEAHRYELRIDVALNAVQGLATQMPAHLEAGRRLRDVARSCTDTDQLASWVDREVATYNRRVTRLKRCRDALIHGGPISMDVAATVQHFANAQAQAVVATVLEAVLGEKELTAV